MQFSPTTPLALLAVTFLLTPTSSAQGGVSRFCQSGAAGATLSASGSTSFGAGGGSGDLVLHVSGVTPGAFGVFFYGSQIQAPSPLGNGFLCIGGGSPLWRLGLASPGSGSTEASLAVDYLTPVNPAAQINAGSTWNFQYWFRSAGTSDTTDGIQILFVPPVSLGVGAEVGTYNRSGHPFGQQPNGGVVLMNSTQQLQDLWARHWSLATNPPPLPAIDMAQNTLVAVFLGHRLSLGYAVQVTDISLSVSTLHISSDEYTPCGGTIFSETNPMQLIAIPRVNGASLGSWTSNVVSCP
jgi:hypothetical protein